MSLKYLLRKVAVSRNTYHDLRLIIISNDINYDATLFERLLIVGFYYRKMS